MSPPYERRHGKDEIPDLDPSEYAPGFFDYLHVNDTPIRVSEFVSEGVQYQIEPALIFRWGYNIETDYFEIFGFKIYRNILVYGKELSEAREFLVNDTLPLFWEEFAKKDDAKLSGDARDIKYDLLSKVSKQCGAQYVSPT